MVEEPDINKILGHAAILGIENLTKRTLQTVRNAWVKSTSRLGFTPTPEEANILKDISNNQTYVAFKSCVGSFNYNKFIKVGILLYELKSKGDLVRVEQIKTEIYNSKYNKYAMKIIHIASTGVLLHTLDYLINLKDQKKFSQYAVREEFKKILELWREVSVSVSNKDAKIEIKKKLTDLIKRNPPHMCLYASGGAALKAQQIVAELSNDRIFSGKYLPWSKNIILYGLCQFLCIFYSIEGESTTPFG